MAKYSQTSDELEEHLRDQTNFMISSAISFDNGFEGEAKRLAIAIRILVHDTSHSTSLLTQLDKMGVLFYDSATTFDPNNFLTSNCLTMIKMSKRANEEEISAEYVAPLERVSPARSTTKRVGFERWWRRSVMYRDRAGKEFTRRDLVLTVADQEGGAHIDPSLNEAYANLSKFNSLGWKLVVNEEEKDFRNNPVPPSIRQIAHEVVKTLRHVAGELLLQEDSAFEVFTTYDEHCEALPSD